MEHELQEAFEQMIADGEAEIIGYDDLRRPIVVIVETGEVFIWNRQDIPRSI